ncbi:MAG: hypothetical protein ACK541_08795 [Burkholderiales bacterium]
MAKLQTVILLVDGLHELYAGTAGGGQVNGGVFVVGDPATDSAYH